MDNKFFGRWLAVAAAVAFAIYTLVPTIRLASMDDEATAAYRVSDEAGYQRDVAGAISLGLDLRGGMHLVLEVDGAGLTEEERYDAEIRALEVIRNRIDEFGVEEPIIQPMGNGRILVQLAGVDDPERAKNVIRRTAFLEFKLVAQSVRVNELLRVIDEIATEVRRDEALSSEESEGAEVVAEVTEPIAEEGEAGESESVAEGDSAFADLFADLSDEPLEANNENPFLSLLTTFSRGDAGFDLAVPEENISEVERILALEEVSDLMPEELEFRLGVVEETQNPNNPFSRYAFLYVLNRDAEITGGAVKRATTTFDQRNFNEPAVSLEFKPDYVKRFAQITGNNTGRQLAIVLDGKVRSAPVLRVRIPDGRAQIDGSFTVADASDLAVVLRSGALPAPIKIVEERTVGSTLGADSIEAGTNAGIFGLAGVIAFMLIYYRAAGVVANGVLILNVTFILAALALFGATLTLPGIAGIVLTMGMAVDANVLIFERIREEFRAGKSVIASIQAGFERAFTTIIDANVTTFITGMILFYFGTGPIRGFAVTLMIGIVTSLFTAIFCSRIAFDFLYSSGRMRRLSI